MKSWTVSQQVLCWFAFKSPTAIHKHVTGWWLLSPFQDEMPPKLFHNLSSPENLKLMLLPAEEWAQRKACKCSSQLMMQSNIVSPNMQLYLRQKNISLFCFSQSKNMNIKLIGVCVCVCAMDRPVQALSLALLQRLLGKIPNPTHYTNSEKVLAFGYLVGELWKNNKREKNQPKKNHNIFFLQVFFHSQLNQCESCSWWILLLMAIKAIICWQMVCRTERESTIPMCEFIRDSRTDK